MSSQGLDRRESRPRRDHTQLPKSHSLPQATVSRPAELAESSCSPQSVPIPSKPVPASATPQPSRTQAWKGHGSRPPAASNTGLDASDGVTSAERCQPRASQEGKNAPQAVASGLPTQEGSSREADAPSNVGTGGLEERDSCGVHAARNQRTASSRLAHAQSPSEDDVAICTSGVVEPPPIQAAPHSDPATPGVAGAGRSGSGPNQPAVAAMPASALQSGFAAVGGAAASGAAGSSGLDQEGGPAAHEGLSAPSTNLPERGRRQGIACTNGANEPGGLGGVGPRNTPAGGNPLALLMRSAAERRRGRQPPGQFLFPRFISEAEEADLVRFLDACEPAWKLSKFNGPHRGKAWGVRMNLQARSVIPPTHPLPPVLLDLAARMRGLPPLADFRPSEANAIDYVRSQGHYLGPHVDDRRLSTGAIVTLSLVSPSVMTFRNEKQPGSAPYRVTLPPGSLQVLTKESRYNFSHGIAQEDIHGARRVSITFRQSPLTS